MHRPAALILVALTAVACHNAPRGGVDQPGAATPQLAVQNFLAAAKAQNLQSLAQLFRKAASERRAVLCSVWL